MSTGAKPDQSELVDALHEMLDGFRRDGVLRNLGIEHATQLLVDHEKPSFERHQDGNKSL
jgi:hypothetical protein